MFSALMAGMLCFKRQSLPLSLVFRLKSGWRDQFYKSCDVVMYYYCMRVFAFLNLEFLPAAWAVMRGMLLSADHMPLEAAEGFVSFMPAGRGLDSFETTCPNRCKRRASHTWESS
jgi:hypothetical protein